MENGKELGQLSSEPRKPDDPLISATESLELTISPFFAGSEGVALQWQEQHRFLKNLESSRE